MEELYRRYYSAMFRHAYGIAREHSIAQDATQDALVELWRNASLFDSRRGRVLSWVLTLTRRRTIDRLRARGVRARMIADSAEVDLVRSSALDPHDDLLARSAAAIVGEIIDVLPADEREPLTLAFHNGLTHAEIADRTGLPLGTIKTRIRRAMQTMRAALDERPARPFLWKTRTQGAPPSLHNVNVLVVEDDIETSMLVALVLRRAGATVITAESVPQAIKRVSVARPDVLVTSLGMPHGDGRWLTMLRGNRGQAKLPAIGFSAPASRRDRVCTPAAGLDLEIAMPTLPTMFVGAVAKVIQASHSAHSAAIA